MNWEEYLSNPQYLADNESRREFGRKLTLAFKQKNISEGMQWYQAVWMHKRACQWKVTLPAGLGGDIIYADVFNMLSSGDIETACLSLQFGEMDDFSKPYHWVTLERITWLTDQMKAWLGWP